MSRVYLRKIDMEILLNATLAGGVVMGTACDDITNPGFAMLVGAISGVISSFGFLKMNDWLKKKVNLHDTCGITFLHALPGTLGGFVSVICAASMNYNFGSKLQQELVAPRIQTRSVSEQAGFQLAAMGITTCISISSAILASFVASRLPHPEIIFDDAVHFDKVHYGDGIAKFNLENKVAGAAESIAQKTH